jgi:adenylosuccinate synthase
MVDVILGLQWGDEGKGKIVDYFAKGYDMVARFQGGPNAGHTLYLDGKKIVLHQIPSGIFHQNIENIIGSGVVLDPVTLKKECKAVEDLGVDFRKNLFVSERTHLILPGHRALDKASEHSKGKDKIGSTLKGIGPAYMDKTGRNGLRVGDLLRPDFRRKYDELKSKHQRLLDGLQFDEDISAWESDFFESLELLLSLKIVSGEYFINDRLQQGKRILAEGAQGSMLDVDFGTFPFVTSSNTVTAGVCTGLGIAPQKINEVIGITKAYCTRVGSGPFPTELHDASGEYLRNKGNEFGSTTGRPRRCGWIDLVALRFACMINGVNSIVMTKADILDELDELKVCHAYRIGNAETDRIPFQLADTVPDPLYKSFKGWKTDITGIAHFSDMPEEMRTYISFLGEFIKAPVKYISNGPAREQIVSV